MDRPNYSQHQYTVRYTLNRKRQIREAIDDLLTELHQAQLDMIDQAVDHNDLRQARELIDYIRGLK
jgi:hypothetical protein